MLQSLIDRLIQALPPSPEGLLALARTDAFRDRVASDPDIALSDAAWSTINEHGEALTTRLRSMELGERIAGNPEWLREILIAWMRQHHIQDIVIEDPPAMAKLMQRGPVVEHAVTDDELLAKLFSDKRVFERILGDTALLQRLLTRGRVFELILSDDELLTKLLGNKKLFEHILADDELIQKLLERGRVFEAILNDAGLLHKLLNHSNVFEAILHDNGLLDRLLGKGAVFERILEHPSLLDKLLSNHDTLNHQLASDALSAELLAHSKLPSRVFLNESLRDTILFDDRVFHDPVFERMRAQVEFEAEWKRLALLIDKAALDNRERVVAARRTVAHVNDIPNAVMDCFCEGNQALLRDGRMTFPDRHALWVVLHEILVNEEYYFEAESDTPRVLDCGAHFGMASYYFKTLYPNARVTAFEPMPDLRALAAENMKANGMDVEVVEYALAAEDGPITFFVSAEDSMAGSLTARRGALGDKLQEIQVEGRRLSAYLDEPVDFLKLDIEGAEMEVLEEAAALLKNVAHLFCEYHHGAGLSADRLPRILLILDDAGFDVHVSKSDGSARHARHRPMMHAQDSYSATIWAKRRKT